MTATELLQALTARGAHITTASGLLLARAPKGVLTDEFKTQLRAHKSELQAILTQLDQVQSRISACWYCATRGQPGQSICPSCRALSPNLTEAEADAVTYGPGIWLYDDNPVQSK